MKNNIRWYPNLKITIEKDGINIANYIEKKRYKVTKNDTINLLNTLDSDDTIQQLVDKKIFIEDSLIDEELMKGLRHWKKRKWEPSLDLYLNSRNINYVDKGDKDNTIRKSIIGKYYNQESLPDLPNFEKTFKEKVENIVHTHLTKQELLEKIYNRRSVRKFSTENKVTKQELYNILLEGTFSVNKTKENSKRSNNPLKSFGSAFSYFLVIYDVDGLENGVYYYDVETKEIYIIKKGNYRNIITEYMYGQPFSETAAYSLFVVANFELYQWRYRHDRGLRNLYIEAGRIMQHIVLAANKNNIHGVITPALYDTKLTNLIGLNISEFMVISSITMGKKNV